MVPGLDTFRTWFEGYEGRYVIIGGTACNLIYARYGSPERATHDIDMVILAEAFDSAYFERFVEFVRAGGYEHRGKDGKYELYRFEKPRNEAFPPKLELLGKRPEALADIEARLGRFSTIDAGGSLSAIFLDEDYYALLADGVEMADGLPILSLEYLPVFKMHAWANLTDARAAGKEVHSDEIGKHRRDVLRLCSLFSPGSRVELPDPIRAEVSRFVSEQPWDDNLLRNLKLRMTASEMAGLIADVYLS